MLAASQRGCMINATDCMYSKLPAEDEYLIYSKHVEDIYWNKFKKKLHLVGSYYANALGVFPPPHPPLYWLRNVQYKYSAFLGNRFKTDCTRL